MLDFLLPVVISILVGWAIVTLFRAVRVNPAAGITPEVQDILTRVANETLVILEVEPVNDQFLCYNYFTKEFVCVLDEILKKSEFDSNNGIQPKKQQWPKVTRLH